MNTLTTSSHKLLSNAMDYAATLNYPFSFYVSHCGDLTVRFMLPYCLQHVTQYIQTQHGYTQKDFLTSIT